MREGAAEVIAAVGDNASATDVEPHRTVRRNRKFSHATAPRISSPPMMVRIA